MPSWRPGRAKACEPLLLDVFAMNFGNDGYDLNRMLRFVVGVETHFYPQISKLYERRIETWAAERRAKLGLDKAEEEDLELAIPVGPEPRHEWASRPRCATGRSAYHRAP